MKTDHANPSAEAKLGLWDAVSIILGIIIGAGIYETPPSIMRMMGDPWWTLGIWGVCGVLALIGALCYAELATTYPRSGGDYVYITRAYGPLPGYLFGWAQLAVIQTGSIGLMAYIFADYGTRLYSLGEFSSVIYASAAIVVMTLLNVLGVVFGKTAQNLLTLAKVVGLGAIIVAGFAYADKNQTVSQGQVTEVKGDEIVVKTADGSPRSFKVGKDTKLYVNNRPTRTVKEKIQGEDGKEKEIEKEIRIVADDFKPESPKAPEDPILVKSVKILTRPSTPNEAFHVMTVGEGGPPGYDLLAFAMVLVLLTYGGWNDAAFVAAEVRNRSRNIPLALIIGTAGVTVIYLAVNYAYINGLGFERAQVSNEVAADVLSLLPWEYGEKAMSILVMISALGAVNGLIFTSSRIYATLGSDYSLFSALGQWNASFGTPVWSLVIQMLITLAMVLGVGTTVGQEFMNDVIEFILGPGNRVSWSGQGGFYSLLRCTAPVFWLFFLMTGLGLFTLRRNDPHIERPFRVPLFPIVPLIFCAMCGYMVYSGVLYAGRLGLVGGLLVVAGVPLYVFSRRYAHTDTD